jgi:hypothetical protein
MRKIISLMLLLFSVVANAQQFNRLFLDKTLRLDYIFAGDSKCQEVFLDGIVSSDGWFGRRTNLSKLPLKGNGDVNVIDKISGDTIYRTSFSSLFQEWICEAEAASVKRSFENSFLIPCPKNEAIVVVRLF